MVDVRARRKQKEKKKLIFYFDEFCKENLSNAQNHSSTEIAKKMKTIFFYFGKAFQHLYIRKCYQKKKKEKRGERARKKKKLLSNKEFTTRHDSGCY